MSALLRKTFLFFLFCSFLFAASKQNSWNIDANGNWNNSANWSDSSFYPNDNDTTASFLKKITANRSITLTDNIKIASIVFDSPKSSYSIDGNKALTFENISSDGLITISSGSHFLGPSLEINLSSNLSIKHNYGSTFTISSSIKGDSLTYNGLAADELSGITNSTLSLAGSNSHKKTFISGGILSLDATGAIPYNSILQLTGSSTLMWNKEVLPSQEFYIKLLNKSKIDSATRSSTIFTIGQMDSDPTSSVMLRDSNTMIFLSSLGPCNISGVLSSTSAYSNDHNAAGFCYMVSNSADNYFSTTFSAANTYYCRTFINGILIVKNNNSLGTNYGNDCPTSGGSPVFVAKNGQLQIAPAGSSKLTLTKEFYLNGSGRNYDGAIKNIGSNTLNGKIYLGWQSSLESKETVYINTPQITDSLTINASISDDTPSSSIVDLTKTGFGTLIYSGSVQNTYLGNTYVRQGSLRVSKNGAFNPLSSVFVSDGASLEINNSSTIGSEIFLGGQGSGTNGALRNLSRNNTLTGKVNIGWESSPTKIQVDADTLNISGTLQGFNDLIKAGNGILNLSGSANNTFSGTTTISAGTVLLSKTSALASSGDIIINGGTLKWNSGAQLSLSNIVLNGGTFNLNRQTETIQSLTYNGGTLDLCSGNLSLSSTSNALTLKNFTISNPLSFIGPSSNIVFDSSNNGTAVLNALNLGGGNRTFIIPRGTASLDMEIKGVLSNGSIIKKGPGILRFSNNKDNSYKGLTTVLEGALELNSNPNKSTILGDVLIDGGSLKLLKHSQISSLSNMTICSGRFDLNDLAESFSSLTMSGGNVDLGKGNLTLNSPSKALILGDNSPLISGAGYIFLGNENSGVVFNGTSGKPVITNISLTKGSHPFDIAKADGSIDLDIVGSIDGYGGILKNGKGVLNFSGTSPNSYLGNTYINEGSIRIEKNDPFKGNADIYVSDKASLEINFDNLAISSHISLNGPGVSNNGALRTFSSNCSLRGIVDLGWGSSTPVAIQVEQDALTISSVIQGPQGLIKQGDGRLIFSGTAPNTYKGDTYIPTGPLRVSKTGAFNPDTNVYVYENAALEIDSDSAIASHVFLNKAGIDQTGALRSLSGNNSLVGSLDVGWGEVLEAVILNVEKDTLSLCCPINGKNDLFKIGSGTLKLCGSEPSTYMGAIKFTEGMIELSKRANTPCTLGDIYINGGILKNLNSNQLSSSTNVYLNNGTYDLNGNDEKINSLTYLGGTLDQGIGVLSLSNSTLNQAALTMRDTVINGPINFTGAPSSNDIIFDSANNGTAYINGPIDLGNVTRVFNIQRGTEKYDMIINGSLNNGSIQKEGEGVLRIEPNTNANILIVIVNKGILSVQGQINAQHLIIRPGGELKGTGYVFGNTTIDGIIAPANSIGTLTLSGNPNDHVFTSTSLYQAELSPTQSDLINIIGDPVGNLTIEPGATLQLLPEMGIYPNDYRSTIVQTNGQIFGTFTNVINSYPFFNVLYYSNHIDVQFLINNLDPLADRVKGGNPGEVAKCLDNINAIAGSDMAYIKFLLPFYNNTELRKILNSLHPAIYKALSLTTEKASLCFKETIVSRTKNLYDTICNRTSFETKKINLWLDIFGDFGHQKGKNEVRGFESKTASAVVGVDYSFIKNQTAGSALGVTSSGVNWNESLAKGDIQSIYLALYNSYFTQKCFLNTFIYGGYSFYKAKREIKEGFLDREASNHHKGFEIATHLSLGYFMKAFAEITPFFSFDYIYLSENKFRENHANDLNLNVKNFHTNLFREEVGLNFSKCFNPTGLRVIPGVKISAVREDRVKGSSYMCSFINYPNAFEVKGLSPDRTLGSLGIYLTTSHKSDFFFSLRYDLDLDKNYWNQKVNLQATLKF